MDRVWKTFLHFSSFLKEGTTHIVWAVGRGPLYALDGVNVSRAENKGKYMLQSVCICNVRR